MSRPRNSGARMGPPGAVSAARESPPATSTTARLLTGSAAARLPFRIAMVLSRCFPDATGGTEIQAHRLARTLARRDHDVRVFGLNSENERPAFEALDGVRIHRVRSLLRAGRPAGGGLGTPLVIGRFVTAIRRAGGRFHVIHSHLASFPTAAAVAAGRMTRARVIVKLAGSGEIGDLATLGRIGWRAYGPIIRAAVRRVDGVVATTDELAAEATNFGFEAPRIVRIPNGVEIPPLGRLDPGARADMRRSLGCADRAVVLSVGRLQKSKRYDLLIEAIDRLRGSVPSTLAIIVGDGPERDALASMVDSRGLRDHVRLAGFVPGPGFYPAADLFALCSESEGMSNALLEAMAHALPSVLSDIPSFRETASNETAVFFTIPDAAALASALSSLLRDQGRAGRLGDAARARARAHFDIERIADAHERLYGALMRGRPLPGARAG